MNYVKRLKAVWNQRKHVILFGVISMLYSLGGGGWKVLRRYCMPLVIVAAIKPFRKTWQNLLVALILAVPLHYGYTEIVDGQKWLYMLFLGLIMGISWYPLAKKRTVITAGIMAAAFTFSVYANKIWGLDWMWSEYIVGTGYGLCYLACKAE